jgi:hypothetical protein
MQGLVLERPVTSLRFSAEMRGLIDTATAHYPNRSDRRLRLTALTSRQQLIYAAFIADSLGQHPPRNDQISHSGSDKKGLPLLLLSDEPR